MIPFLWTNRPESNRSYHHGPLCVVAWFSDNMFFGKWLSRTRVEYIPSYCKIKLETSQLQEGVTAKTATSFTIRLAASCGHNCTVAIVSYAALAIRLSASKVRGGFLTNELQAGLRAGLLIKQLQLGYACYCQSHDVGVSWLLCHPDARAF